MNTVSITYDDDVVRKFIKATMLWGVVALLLGVIVASQLAFPELNLGLPFTAYGRLRPLHTNAAIFAFVGNMMFAGVYYSTQRLLKTPMPSRGLSLAHFWGWQAIIVSAALTLPFGFTQGKEYAELEWPIDLAVTAVWVIFAINFFWALAVRREKNLYVALWFYISTIITVAVLYIVNNLALPVLALKSYSLFSGVQDALVQWWYGHNAVAFFLTTPILGIMYYFMPKAAERPVYSYRLSIVHFWALVFLYIWAGPHHLLYTALPDWAQTLGMIFSLMLWAPSWGGMLNGLLTLRGAWGKLRTDPVIKFFVAGLTFYGMSTFEGPLLSIKSVSALAHYTDWIVAHVHGGALGWNGFMAAGMLYWLVPRLYGKPLHSQSMANAHFWMGTLGIVIYMTSMWVSGISQGLMWKAINPDGALSYPSFIETLTPIRPLYITRMLGGTLYLVGFIVMVVNLVKTMRAGAPVDVTVQVVEERVGVQRGGARLLVGKPVVLSVAGLVVLALLGVTNVLNNVIATVLGLALVAYVYMTHSFDSDEKEQRWHQLMEGRPLVFTALVLIAVLVGGVAELVPTIVTGQKLAEGSKPVTPYRALELHGRDIYVREGCYNCHSQMIRPLPGDAARYGEPSAPEESFYDHPFQWGSKRTGPDLARVGGKYPNLWHYEHFKDPRAISPGSNMPGYAWMADAPLAVEDTVVKVRAMKTLGVPYTTAQVAEANADLEQQAREIVADLAKGNVNLRWDSELTALIAYMQRLGKPGVPATDDKKNVVSMQGVP
ncbi:MAG: cytochrome-c oxidase, cbb3-type subunit I [Myxococcota bacterium]